MPSDRKPLGYMENPFAEQEREAAEKEALKQQMAAVNEKFAKSLFSDPQYQKKQDEAEKKFREYQKIQEEKVAREEAAAKKAMEDIPEGRAPSTEPLDTSGYVNMKEIRKQAEQQRGNPEQMRQSIVNEVKNKYAQALANIDPNSNEYLKILAGAKAELQQRLQQAGLK